MLGLIHDPVATRRIRVLSTKIDRLIDPGDSLLDVGCGDGALGASIQRLSPRTRILGADTLIRDGTAIDAFRYDGAELPVVTGAVEGVLLVDVLHHTTDPERVLAEAARVARKYVIVKDHLMAGLLASPTLRLMDWVGNARFGVSLPYNYLAFHDWDRCISACGLVARTWDSRLGLYPFPLSVVFERRLHFLARLEPAP